MKIPGTGLSILGLIWTCTTILDVPGKAPQENWLLLMQCMGYGDNKYLKLEEQLAIFLYGSVTGLSVRHLGEHFQRSNDTIAKWVLIFVVNYI